MIALVHPLRLSNVEGQQHPNAEGSGKEQKLRAVLVAVEKEGLIQCKYRC